MWFVCDGLREAWVVCDGWKDSTGVGFINRVDWRWVEFSRLDENGFHEAEEARMGLLVWALDD